MGEFFHPGPRVRYIWLIAKPCATYKKNAEIDSALWAGEMVDTAAGVCVPSCTS